LIVETIKEKNMEKMSDLPRELVEEILSRVPVKSMREVRVTCKTWNALSKHISKAEAAREGEFLGIAKVWNRVYLNSVNLHVLMFQSSFLHTEKGDFFLTCSYVPSSVFF